MYSKIKIFGEQDVNYSWCKEGISTNDEIDIVVESGICTQTRDSKTITLATFVSNLSASESSTAQTVYGYKIQRLNTKEDILYKVADLDGDILRIQDYNIPNKNSFKYYITPIFVVNDIQTLGSPIVTDTITTDWIAWSVVGMNPTTTKDVYTVDEDQIWSFDLNVESDPVAPKYDKTYQEGFGRFAKAGYGDRNYIESGVKHLLGAVSQNGEYINDNIQMLEKWEQFCNNGQLKLLKNRKGRVLPIDIKDTSSQDMDDVEDQVTTISFSYLQLADNKEISVYGTVSN